jgi:Secretion system C-terminal sorting domain
VTAATGIITTFAGTSGMLGHAGDGGPATSATLAYPWSMTEDVHGNFYIADFDVVRPSIRKIAASTGIITTYAGGNAWPPPALHVDTTGNGGPATAAVILPYSLVFDTCGNLYLTDQCAVRVITPTATPHLCGYMTDVPAFSAGAEEISIYPNPSSGTFTIVMPANTAEARVVVTDMLGRKVKEQQLMSAKTELKLDAPPGTYLVSCTAGEQRWCRQVVVR